MDKVIEQAAEILEPVFEQNNWHWWDCSNPKREEIAKEFEYLIRENKGIVSDTPCSSRIMSGRLAVLKHSWGDDIELYLHVGTIHSSHEDEDI